MLPGAVIEAEPASRMRRKTERPGRAGGGDPVSHRTPLIVAFVLVLSTFLAPRGHAQESLVSIDAEGKIDRIDLRLERKLMLFPDYPDFREARLFRLADSSFVLEIGYGPEGKLSRVRLPMTVPEVESLRQKVTDAVAVRAPQAVLERGGRTKLLVGTTILSLGFYGWACPVAFNAKGGSEVVGLYMLTAGTTMVLPIILTRDRNVSDASATLALYGATRGIAHGIMLDILFSGGDEDGRDLTTAAWLASMTEGVVGYTIADRSQMTKGHAEMIGAGGDAGMLLAAGAATLTEAKDGGAAGIGLAGAGLGMFGGHLLADDGRFTRGDSYLFRAAGTLGALLGVTAASAFDPEDDQDKAYTACAMTGGVAGLAYGTGLARKTNLTGAEGVMLNVGMLGGGLLGLGIMVLAEPETDSGFPYLIASSVGATTGFAIAYHFVAPGTEEVGGGPSWDLELAPQMAESAGAAGHRNGVGRSLGLSLRLRSTF